MTQCWPLQGMSAPQKAVLISLADNSNDDGVCWPSVAKIAERTCLSERAVRNALRWLEDAKILISHQRNGRSTWYTVTRWNDSEVHQDLGFWRDYFETVRASDFLMGRVTGRDGKVFRCCFDWLIAPSNFVKVVEGNYHA
ncbi:hypothetical protein CAZ01_06460 [Pseudomonas aeruginosa]|nr:hypothetical protein CAZ01_06460 [Pseudomonas aeruginosa]